MNVNDFALIHSVSKWIGPSGSAEGISEGGGNQACPAARLETLRSSATRRLIEFGQEKFRAPEEAFGRLEGAIRPVRPRLETLRSSATRRLIVQEQYPKALGNTAIDRTRPGKIPRS